MTDQAQPRDNSVTLLVALTLTAITAIVLLSIYTAAELRYQHQSDQVEARDE